MFTYSDVAWGIGAARAQNFRERKISSEKEQEDKVIIDHKIGRHMPLTKKNYMPKT